MYFGKEFVIERQDYVPFIFDVSFYTLFLNSKSKEEKPTFMLYLMSPYEDYLKKW